MSNQLVGKTIKCFFFPADQARKLIEEGYPSVLIEKLPKRDAEGHGWIVYGMNLSSADPSTTQTSDL